MWATASFWPTAVSFISGHSVSLNGSDIVSDGADTQIAFAGDVISLGTTTLTSANSGDINFVDANVKITGTLTSTPGAGIASPIVLSGGGGKLFGGTLDFHPDARLLITGGEIGTEGVVLNQGAIEWQSGKVTGGGLINQNATAGQVTTSPTAAALMVESGLFQNEGHFTQGKLITLATGGQIANAADATYLLQSAGIGATETGMTTQVVNDGTLVVTGPAQISARFKNITNGRIVIQDSGELRVQGPTELHNRITVDTTTGIDSRFTYNTGVHGSRSVGLTYEFVGDGTGDVKFMGGTNELEGTLTSIGVGKVRLDNGDVNVAAGKTATLNMAPSAPFLFDADTILVALELEGPLTNQGAFVWNFGEVVGPQPLINTGSIDIAGTMRIGDSGVAGQVTNAGRIDVTAPSGGIGIHGTGRLLNQASGFVDFKSNADVALLSAATQTLFVNTGGEVRKSAGTSSFISVPFKQTSGKITVQSGTLQLNSEPQLLGGRVEISSADSNAPILVVAAPSTTEDLTVSITDGEMRYGIGSGLHIFKGMLSGSGTNGVVRLVGGTFSITAPATFNVTGTQMLLDHQNGTTSGAGSITNRGTYLFENGAIANDGGFVNLGTFDWAGGSIGATFTNESSIDEPQPHLIVDGNTTHDLGAETLLINKGKVSHTGTAILTLSENTRIQNRDNGEYGFTGAGQVQRATSDTVGAEFSNEGGTVRREGLYNTSPAVIAVPFVNATDAVVEVIDTSPIPPGSQDSRVALHLTSGGRFNGGAIRVTGYAQLETTGLTLNEVDHQFPVDATDILSASTSHTNALLRGPIETHGRGSLLFYDPTVPAGSDTSFNFPDSINSISQLFKLFGTASLELGELLLFSNIQFSSGSGAVGRLINAAEGQLVFFSAIGLTRLMGDASAGSDFAMIDNLGTIRQESSLRLEDRVRIENFGVYTIAGELTLSNDETREGSFRNPGKFLSAPGKDIGSVVVQLPFDNTGEVVADLGTTRFSDLLQFFPTGRILKGGTYTVRPGGRIVIEGVTAFTENAASVHLIGDATFSGLEKVKANSGEVTISGGKQFESIESINNTGTWAVEGPNSQTTWGGDYQQSGTGSSLAVQGDATMAEPEQPAVHVGGDLSIQDGELNTNWGKVNVEGTATITAPAVVRQHNSDVTTTTFHLQNIDYESSGDSVIITTSGESTITGTSILLVPESPGNPATMQCNGGITVREADFDGEGSVDVSGVLQFPDRVHVGGQVDLNVGGNAGGAGLLFVTDTASFTMPNPSTSLTTSGEVIINTTQGARMQVGDWNATGRNTLLFGDLGALIDNGVTGSPVQVGTMTVSDGTLRGGYSGETFDVNQLTIPASDGFDSLVIVNGSKYIVGDSPGIMIVGQYTQDATSEMEIEVGGSAPGREHDLIVITGEATLAGTLRILPTGGFMPQPGQQFTFLIAGHITDTFDTVTGPGEYTVSYSATEVTITVVTPPICGEIVRPDLDHDCDVDADDFAMFKACYSGPTIEAPVACDNSDFDTDFDVDHMDFAIFQRCISGDGHAPDPACAN